MATKISVLKWADARFLAVAGKILAVDFAWRILAADERIARRLRDRTGEGLQDFQFSLRTAVASNVAGGSTEVSKSTAKRGSESLVAQRRQQYS